MTRCASITRIVEPAAGGLRLDRFLCDHVLPELGVGTIQRLIREGQVQLNGRPSRKGARLRAGDAVTVPAGIDDEAPVPEAEPTCVVLAETRTWVAFNKPAGVASHPLRPAERGTLANAIAAAYPECVAAGAARREAGLVHRLDRPTSGVILAARTRAAYAELRGLFTAGAFHKRYLALVSGVLPAAREVTLALRTQPDDRRRVEVAPGDACADAMTAETHITPLAHNGSVTLVAAQASTGRRHQIRAHLAAIGHPLIGDALYGGPAPAGLLHGVFLHAHRVHCAQASIDVTAELPADRQAFLVAAGVDYAAACAALERLEHSGLAQRK